MSEEIEEVADCRVAHVSDESTVVVNIGASNGVRRGQRFLFYSIGEQIRDPESGASLGNLEVVKGIGKVTHVQIHMATIESDMKSTSPRTITKRTKRMPASLAAIVGSEVVEEEVDGGDVLTFDGIAVGDFGKLI